MALLAAAFLLLWPGGAMAQDVAPEVAPGYEEYEGCPNLLDTPSISRAYCLNITVHDGHLNLGSVDAELEDLQMNLALMVAGGETQIVEAEGEGGGSEPISVSGGLLGIPALDPIIENDPLGLLSIHATPTLGDLEHENLDTILELGVSGLGFASYPDGAPILEGDDPAPLPQVGEEFCGFAPNGNQICIPPGAAAYSPWPAVNIGLPISIELDNLLFGSSCEIDPIELEVTTGTTEPPEHVEPLTGDTGFLARNTGPMGGGTIEFHIDDMQFVGNAFEVPGAKGCNTLSGLGYEDTAIESLINADSLINSQVGLPSPAGNNAAELAVDVHAARMEYVYGIFE